MMANRQSHTSWSEKFMAEREELLSELGHMVEGGLVEDIQHIGATSVPGVAIDGPVDLAISIWPFPLEAKYRRMLEDRGYDALPDAGRAGEDRFLMKDGRYQLFL